MFLLCRIDQRALCNLLLPARCTLPHPPLAAPPRQRDSQKDAMITDGRITGTNAK